jgi:hypothetical protein
MKTEPGAELTCRARNYHFEYHGSYHEHGIISYYAVRTLPQATTMASWLQHIEAMSRTDLRENRLPWFYQPSLQILGHAATRLPGTPVGANDEQNQYETGAE